MKLSELQSKSVEELSAWQTMVDIVPVFVEIVERLTSDDVLDTIDFIPVVLHCKGKKIPYFYITPSKYTPSPESSSCKKSVYAIAKALSTMYGDGKMVKSENFTYLTLEFTININGASVGIYADALPPHCTIETVERDATKSEIKQAKDILNGKPIQYNKVVCTGGKEA